MIFMLENKCLKVTKMQDLINLKTVQNMNINI